MVEIILPRLNKLDLREATAIPRQLIPKLSPIVASGLFLANSTQTEGE